jgi:hypothetical protein
MMRRVGFPQNLPHLWHSSVAAASVSASASSTSIPGSLSTPSYYTTPVPAPALAFTHEAMDVRPPETPVPASGAVFPTTTASTEGVTPSIDVMPESDDASTSTSTSTFSSSGEDSVHNTAHPSAAFLLASRQRGRHDYDDHDDDDDDPDNDGDFDDSLDADADAALAPVHPFARARALSAQDDAAEYDDSFDSFDGGDRNEGEEVPEETVFGVRPAEREAAQPRLRMLGEDLLQDTIGIGTQLARAGRIEESPTPWGGGRGGRGG